jgi:hypothetical protein
MLVSDKSGWYNCVMLWLHATIRCGGHEDGRLCDRVSVDDVVLLGFDTV